MRTLFKEVNISVAKYKSERASGYRYEVPLDGKNHEIIMITEFEGVATPYLYSNTQMDDKERERAYALVIEHECQKGNEWAEKMKRTAIVLWDMIKAEGGEVVYHLADKAVCITPCIYDKEIKDAAPADIEYYLVHDDVIDGGNTIFNVCNGIVNYGKELELHESDIIELQKFFDKHCKEAWGKPYNELSEEERDALSFFSDWHKDVYGYRPHGNEKKRCLSPKEDDYER